MDSVGWLKGLLFSSDVKEFDGFWKSSVCKVAISEGDASRLSICSCTSKSAT